MTNDKHHVFMPVSFVKTPFDEIGPKIAEIVKFDWEASPVLRDPWMVIFEKSFDLNEPDVKAKAEEAKAEVRALMGGYWMEEEDYKDLERNRGIDTRKHHLLIDE